MVRSRSSAAAFSALALTSFLFAAPHAAHAKKGGGLKSPSFSEEEEECNENGYEIWRQEDPSTIDMMVETVVTVTEEDEDRDDSSEDSHSMKGGKDGKEGGRRKDGKGGKKGGKECMYEIKVSWRPTTFLTYMSRYDFVPPTEYPIGDAFCPPPPGGFGSTDQLKPTEADDFDDVCDSLGRTETDVIDPHVGLQDLLAEYTYTIEAPKRVRKATGMDHFTVGAAPCGTFINPWPHYNIHAYYASIKTRKKMVCRTDGGFFCKTTPEQCSEDALKFNLDGEGQSYCDDGSGDVANIPTGWTMTNDDSPIGTNAASAGMGHHGLNGANLCPLVRSYDVPNQLALTWDGTPVATHLAVSAVWVNGQASTTSWENKDIEYNCQDMREFGFLPTSLRLEVDSVTGMNVWTLSGPGRKCKESFVDVAMGEVTKSKGKKGTEKD